MTKTEIRKQMKGLNTALSSEQREEAFRTYFQRSGEASGLRTRQSGGPFRFAQRRTPHRPGTRTLEPLQTDRAAPRGRRHNAILRLRSRLDERFRLVRHFGTGGHCAVPPRGDRFYHRAGCGVHRRRHAPGTRQGILRQIPVAAGFPGFQGRRMLSASSRGGACPPIRSTFRSITFAADGKTSADFGPIIKSYRSHVFSGPKTYPFGIPPSKTGKHRLRQRIVKRENTASKKPASTDAGFLTNIIQYYYR